MSPRKSSTSSGKRARPQRPRYLAVEVTGVPTVSPRELEQLLRRRLGIGPPAPSVRLVRFDGLRGVAEVPHSVAGEARASWNGRVPLADGRSADLVTLRTYGTLRKAKAWLRRRPTPGGQPHRPRGV